MIKLVWTWEERQCGRTINCMQLGIHDDKGGRRAAWRSRRAEVVVADAPPSAGDPPCSASWKVGGGAMARCHRWRLYVYVDSTIISLHSSGCQLNLASPNKTIVELRPDKKE